MTIRELSRYRTLKNEADRLRRKLESEITIDTVSGSSPEFPYCKHSVRVEGLIKRHQQMLHEAYLRAYTEQVKLEKYIQSVEDPLVRDIIRLRFEECMKWEQVADALRGNTGDSCRKAVVRYISAR